MSRSPASSLLFFVGRNSIDLLLFLIGVVTPDEKKKRIRFPSRVLLTLGNVVAHFLYGEGLFYSSNSLLTTFLFFFFFFLLCIAPRTVLRLKTEKWLFSFGYLGKQGNMGVQLHQVHQHHPRLFPNSGCAKPK
ncbi:MAG: hypothetical protein JOS17DRAFT_152383 [Linnemannia elongata]|nr:MAG: hypothetical protein JOS17DRAFT_152383 [Linnemannia elongata]